MKKCVQCVADSVVNLIYNRFPILAVLLFSTMSHYYTAANARSIVGYGYAYWFKCVYLRMIPFLDMENG